jgi:DNA helicase HerA-like ATPase
MLVYLADNAAQISKNYGNVSAATIATIQRKLLVLDEAGASNFFGEPALEIAQLIRTAANGQGYVNVLAADKLVQSPRLYSTFLLWLLSELYEDLPEVGDLEKPKLVFFFDEAHLLFYDAPKQLIEKVEQVVRLIRSKGVGIYFITQNPGEVPETVLGQLGNRFQHALRAFTPKDQKSVKVAAQTFRANPKFSTESAITELAVGEALVSTLIDGGVPSIVERSFICPPQSQIGSITAAERAAVIAGSPIGGIYDKAVDRESAFEQLTKQTEKAVEEEPTKSTESRKSSRMGYGETLAKQVIRTVGSSLGREIVRGILGGILKR